MSKLLSPDPQRIPKPTYESSKDDAVAQRFARGSDRELVDALARIVGAENVFGRVSDLVRYASDGSPYRDIPYELVESATRDERASLERGAYDRFVSDNRTCEMGLEMIAGKSFESIAVLMERASRPEISLA